MSDTPNHELFVQFHEATSVIQLDISKVLVTNADAKKRLEAQLKMTDGAQLSLLNGAVYNLVSFMPLAQLVGVNLVSMVMACHSNITGEPDLHLIYDRINRENLGLPEPEPEEP